MLVGELTVLVIVPNAPDATLPLGTAKVGWLSRLKALAPIWAMLRRNNLAGVFGGGEAGAKIADLINAVQNDLPLPELDLPSQKDAQEKDAQEIHPGQTQSNPVKPEVVV